MSNDNMIREILFQGKRVDNGEWVEGDFCKPCNIVFEEIGYDAALGQDGVPLVNDYAVIPETVGQFTGMTDKNGNKIFEGDIVRIENRKYAVSFEKGCWVIYDKSGFWDFLHTNSKSIEIIGNLYDGFELLKEV